MMETKEHIDYLISRHTDLMHGDLATTEMENIAYELTHTYGIYPDEFGFFEIERKQGAYDLEVDENGSRCARSQFINILSQCYKGLLEQIEKHEKEKEEKQKSSQEKVEKAREVLKRLDLNERYKDIDPEKKKKKAIATPYSRGNRTKYKFMENTEKKYHLYNQLDNSRYIERLFNH